jgi:hypothetical protein
MVCAVQPTGLEPLRVCVEEVLNGDGTKWTSLPGVKSSGGLIRLRVLAEDDAVRFARSCRACSLCSSLNDTSVHTDAGHVIHIYAHCLAATTLDHIYVLQYFVRHITHSCTWIRTRKSLMPWALFGKRFTHILAFWYHQRSYFAIHSQTLAFKILQVMRGKGFLTSLKDFLSRCLGRLNYIRIRMRIYIRKHAYKRTWTSILKDVHIHATIRCTPEVRRAHEEERKHSHPPMKGKAHKAQHCPGACGALETCCGVYRLRTTIYHAAIHQPSSWMHTLYNKYTHTTNILLSMQRYMQVPRIPRSRRELQTDVQMWKPIYACGFDQTIRYVIIKCT